MYRSLFLFLFLATISTLAMADYPDVTGNYSGTLNGIDVDSSPSSCPENAQAFTGSINLILESNPTNGSITGVSGSFTNNNDGSLDTFTINSGSFLDQTTFSFSFTLSDGDPGSLLLQVSGSILTIISGGVTDLGGVCDSVITGGTLARTGSTVLASENTPSSTVTDALLFNLQIQSTISGISNRIGAALAGIGFFINPTFGDNQFKLNGTTGLNAGDGEAVPYGIWGNYSYTDFENDLSTTAIDGRSHSFLGGIDFQFWENTVMGVAMGFDNSDIDTNFNSGNQQVDTITIAPYFGAVLTDFLSADFNIGYSNVSYDQFRTAGTTRVNSDPNSDRWFGAFNLNGIHFIDRWIIGGRVGMLFASSVINSYIESNGSIVEESRNKVGTVSVGGNVAYSFNEWEPFLTLSYQYDYQLQEIVAATGPQPSNDKDDILLTTGIRYFEKSGITGNLEYSKRFTRQNFNEDRISLTIRADF